MNIPETSLIPSTVALLKFFHTHGLQSFLINYPYWYLGDVPFKYLIGPIVPILFKNDLLINNLIYFIPIFILVSSIGWATFFLSFFKEKKISLWFLVFILMLLSPWQYIYGVAVSDFTDFFAKSLIPFFLLLLYKKKHVLSVIVLTLMLLISTSVLPSVLVFSIILSLKNWKSRVSGLVKVFLFSIIISSLWYGPIFWLRILMNPSIGGKVGVSAIFGAIDFIRIILPMVVAVLVVKFSSKLTRRLPIFIVGSLVTFSTMTLYRFISNPYFWMDWITWFYEVEISLALLVTYMINKNRRVYLFLLSIPVIWSLMIGSRLKFTPSSERAVVESLGKIAGDNRVFMSGSTVFWSNSFSNVIQLRGGRDEVSKNSEWLDASYVFRESKDKDLITKDLQKLNIKYVLVHTKNSPEFYHDFKNEDIWDSLGEKVYSQNGDIIYKVN